MRDSHSLPDLRIKEGVILRPNHFRPMMTAIVHAVLKTAPGLYGNAVTITSALRRVDETKGERSKGSLHEKCWAFDFRCKNISARDQAERERIAHDWADDIREILGTDYDVMAHGGETNPDNLHIHVEFDPK